MAKVTWQTVFSDKYKELILAAKAAKDEMILLRLTIGGGIKTDEIINRLDDALKEVVKL